MMIEINLLPQELKIKNKNDKLGLNKLLYIAPALVGLLILLHVYFIVASVSLNMKLVMLQGKWKTLEPERKRLDVLKKNYSSINEGSSEIQQLFKERIIWAEKLNLLSAKLPPGVWFTELSVTTKDFILKGSVISLQKQELGLLNKFLSSLKDDAGFFKNFINLELSSAQRETLGSYEIINFSINGLLRQ